MSDISSSMKERDEENNKKIRDKRKTVVDLGKKVTDFSQGLRSTLENFSESTLSRSVQILAQEKLPLLRALESTHPDLIARLDSLDRSFHNQAEEVISRIATTKSSAKNLGVILKQSKAEAFALLSEEIERNSEKLRPRIKKFHKAAGMPEVNLEGLELVINFAELYLKSHFGPWITLIKLIKKRAKERKVTANPFEDVVKLLATFDLLIETLVAISILMRQIPAALNKGKYQSIEYDTAKNEFLSIVETHTKSGESADISSIG